MLTSYDHRKNMIFATIAAIAGLVYSIADYILELLPHASETLDKYGVVESAWMDMASSRFVVSLTLSAIITPFFVAGYICVYKQIRESSPRFSKAFVIVTLIGGLGDFFIHAILCIMPIVYKAAYELTGQEQAVQILEKMTGSFIVPFYCYFAFIFAGYILWFIYSLGKRSIYRKWCVALVVLAVILQLIFAVIPGLEAIGVGALSRLEMTFFIFAAVKEYQMIQKEQ